jgi:hypothetical protein
MLYINNPQAAEAILEGRRHSDGQRRSSEELAMPDRACEPPSERQVLLPRLSALLTTT